jgi:hypothetical protein
MASLPRQIAQRCRVILRRCQEFENHNALKAVFIVDELENYKDDLPQTDNKNARVDETIEFLLSRTTESNKSAFILFLNVLKDKYEKYDAVYQDSIYIELQNLLMDIEKHFSQISIKSKQKIIKSENVTKVIKINNKGNLTRQQVNACISANSYYESVKTMHKTIKDAARFFNKPLNEIYPLKCKEMLNYSLALRKPVFRFTRFLDATTHLPASVQNIRISLVRRLNEIDTMLADLNILKKVFCPECLKVSTNKLQQIRQDLQQIHKCLSSINQLMCVFKRTVGLFEEPQAPFDKNVIMTGSES